MPSTATTTYAALLADVDALVELHSGAGSRTSGQNDPLLRAAVVLLVTSWENYIEQTVVEAFAHVLTQVGDDPRLLSDHLRQTIQREAGKDAWAVIGDGWRAIARAEVESLVSALNNAASGQVDQLVFKALGISSFLTGVSWASKTAAEVREELRSLVNDVRGEIVHKGTTPGVLNISGVNEWKNFVTALVAEADVVLADEIERRYGSRPWGK